MKIAGWLAFLLPWVSALAANAPEEIVTKTMTYKQVAGRELQVDVFQPSGSAPAGRPRPAIAFFHGGGWVFGDRTEFHGACRRYAEKGFVTFSFQYRLSIKADGSYPHPQVTLVESVKDARSAIRWLRANAAALGVDPRQIVVGGQSAGGQLAWSTVLCDGINEATDDLAISPCPTALLLYSSNYNSMEPWIDMIMGSRREEIWTVSPYHNLKAGLPPALAFHSRDDRMVLYYSVDMFAVRTRALGNSYELVTLSGRDHYLGEGHPEYARYFDEDILRQTDAFLGRLGLMPAGR